jgi:N12 class adenine-specific DNA methylase
MAKYKKVPGQLSLFDFLSNDAPTPTAVQTSKPAVEKVVQPAISTIKAQEPAIEEKIQVLDASVEKQSMTEPAEEPQISDDILLDKLQPSQVQNFPIVNFRITSDEKLGFGGAKAKFADNIAAIRLLHQLHERGVKAASSEEKKILVRYVGWGGIPQAFDQHNEKWASEYQELLSVLPPDDYAKARRSTQDAHYTSETVIRGIYQGLEHLGLNAGDKPQILEPSAGIGNFIGLRPDWLDGKFTAVELDLTTAAIAGYLYPETRLFNKGFQNTGFTEGTFDVVIGNPPFGKQSLYDPDFTDLRGFSIHNYFLAKSIRLLREGGIAAFVVSRYFLDAVDPTAREHIAQYADFLGAVRLPDTAFRQNALTDVTTDIVFFQKNSGASRQGPDWTQVAEVQADDRKEGGTKPATINQYYKQYPDRIIGKMVFPASGGMYAGTILCEADPSLDLGLEIENRLGFLPEVYIPQHETAEKILGSQRNEELINSLYFQSLKTGAFCVEPQSRKIVYKTIGYYGDSSYAFLSVKSDMAQSRIVSMIHVRDTLRELLNAEKTDAEEGHIESLRRQLNINYDSHVRRFGHLNSQTNRSLMREDPEHSLLESLEMGYDKGLSPEAAKRQGRTPREASATKAAIFQKRVLHPTRIADRAENVKDALIIALRETGKVDFSRMDQLLHRPAESIKKELAADGLIFQNPACREVGREWEIRDKYLTGNVREKLRMAREAAKEDESFQANADALAAVLPPDIEAVDIGIKFGSPWVPGEVITDFIDHLHGGKGRASVRYIPVLGKWEIKVAIYDRSLSSDVWGIPEYPAEDIIESLLSNRPIKVEKDAGRDDHGNQVKVVDQELTAAAMSKADAIRQEFLDWVWQDDTRRENLTRLYNDRFNTNVPPRYDGSHISLVNASSEVALRPHQKDVVWRGIQEGTALFDHVVGAGKTLACIATIMESKRMGFLAKPMVIVPNHLLYQWRDEFFRLYPGANILVADKTDFTKQNRERFFSRVATGDWDAVIVAHSSFKKIDMPHDVQQEILQEQISLVVDAIRQAKEDRGSRATIKQLEKQKEKMEARFQLLLAGTGPKDRSVDFGDLGVDGLFVDESHEFKNLGYATTMNVSGLGNITGSAKALDLFIKCRYLQKRNNGRGVYFMTGTPISNTIAEVYTLKRYLQYEELQAKGVEHFDAWASTFGQITSGWELDATGVNYKLKSRFASFQNVPELLAMYRTFADVVTKNDLDEQSRQAGQRSLAPPITGGKPHNHVVDRSGNQAEYMESIIHRMENLPRDPRIDNPLCITNDARKAGLDYRLIDPEAGDYPGSKVNDAVERIYDIWRDTSSDRGTQLVFCDLSTPKGGFKTLDKPLTAEPELFFEDGSLSNAYGPDSSVAVDTMEEGEDDGEDHTTAKFMDDAVVLTSRFSVYDDVKHKLIDKGIPADEIAFIHDANTDLRKAKLFSDMQAGRVRILMGSTSKMGAGMNVQKRLVAAHHLDAPWRPSDLEQRNGRIIRQGNMLYESDPDNFSVDIFYYATKRTYDARMWQTIEYKAAAIEQFRKGDLLQRVIEDVQSEAANAAEMKAAASGNPLILMQVRLSSDLRKLEALYAQHQRSQHRLRDRLRWLDSAQERLDKAGAVHAADLQYRDAHTHIQKDNKGKERIRVELVTDERALGEKDEASIKTAFVNGVKSAGKENRALIGSYRGFEVYALRHLRSGAEGFRFALKGRGDQEFQPENLIYSYDDTVSISGWFQRMDNFLDKGLEQAFQTHKGKIEREIAELATVQAALGQDFAQKDELDLTRENHAAVMRELQRMQNEPGYISTWNPKESLPEPGTQTDKASVALPADQFFKNHILVGTIPDSDRSAKDIKTQEPVKIAGEGKESPSNPTLDTTKKELTPNGADLDDADIVRYGGEIYEAIIPFFLPKGSDRVDGGTVRLKPDGKFYFDRDNSETHGRNTLQISKIPEGGIIYFKAIGSDGYSSTLTKTEYAVMETGKLRSISIGEATKILGRKSLVNIAADKESSRVKGYDAQRQRLIGESVALGRDRALAELEVDIFMSRSQAWEKSYGIDGLQQLRKITFGKAPEKRGFAFAQPAFNGSPTRGIERMSLDFIGTGEGIQAYGWGLYFAGNREVSEEYRKRLSPVGLRYKDGTKIDEAALTENERNAYIGVLYEGLSTAQRGFEEGVKDTEEKGREYHPDRYDRYHEGLAFINKLTDQHGQLYEVEIPSDDVLLDYDKPISEQPEKVKKALEQLHADLEAEGYSADDVFSPLRQLNNAIRDNDLGKEIYYAVQRKFPSESSYTEVAGNAAELSSHLLGKYGILGLRYLDGNSRAQGEGSHNYVIWDDSTIDIVRTYYQQGEGSAMSGKTQVALARDYGRRVKEAATEWAKVVRKFVSGEMKKREVLTLGETPDILTSIKQDALPKLPLVLTQDIARKATGRSAEKQDAGHKLTDEQLADLPYALADPVAMLHADNSNTVIITDILVSNNPVIVAIQPDAEQGNIKVNDIRSAYGRTGFSGWFLEQVKSGSMRYFDNKKSVALGEHITGFEIPRVITAQRSSGQKITWGSEVVKPDYSENIKNISGDGKTFNKDARGAVTFAGDKAYIQLFGKQDASTVIHEAWHIFLNDMITLAAKGEAPEAMRRDLQTLRDFSGLKDGEPFGSEHHELIARAGEAYMREGIAPSTGLAEIFEKFKTWLTSLYKSAQELNVTLTPEVRSVFDRMLTPAQSQKLVPEQTAPAEQGKHQKTDFDSRGEKTSKTVDQRTNSTDLGAELVRRASKTQNLNDCHTAFLYLVKRAAPEQKEWFYESLVQPPLAHLKRDMQPNREPDLSIAAKIRRFARLLEHDANKKLEPRQREENRTEVKPQEVQKQPYYGR